MKRMTTEAPEARLEQAKRLFLDPSEKVIKRPVKAAGYNLRKRKLNPVISTDHDADDSGDYSPSSSKQARQAKRKRSNSGSSGGEEGNAEKRSSGCREIYA
ncbi:putative C6 finger domain protein [Aspergillus stella-maris]|uniref:putative C6 finger domain protein n=1 Tax=Aspergillus stella-maris TaxID=1810926 RepID=UPI003CCCA84C